MTTTSDPPPSTAAAGGAASNPSAIEFEPPLACVRRILKNTLPSTTNVGKDASSALARACGIFVIYITACANDFARENKRQTITANDVLAAIKELEFDEFTPQLEAFLERYRATEKVKKDAKAKATAAAKASAAATTDAPTTPARAVAAEDDDDEDMEDSKGTPSSLVAGVTHRETPASRDGASRGHDDDDEDDDEEAMDAEEEDDRDDERLAGEEEDE